MRKIFWTVVTILAVTFSGFFGFGMNLPKTHAFTVEEIFEAPQDEVWKAITDYEYLPTWSGNVQSTERQHDLEGKPLWRLNSQYGRFMDLHIIEETPEFLHVAEIIDGNYPFMGIWRFRIVKGQDEKVLVELTEEGIIESPFWRVVMRNIVGQETGARSFMRELGAHLKTVAAKAAVDEEVSEGEESSEEGDEGLLTEEDEEANTPESDISEENATQ